MTYKIIIIALIIAQCIATPCYLVAIKPGFSKKTLLLKMLCSTIFVATGVAAALYTGNIDTLYAKCFIIAFVCSWFGDVMLHLEGNIVRYIIGGLGFLTAHVLFIYAYVKTAASVTGETAVITVKDVIIMAVLYIIFAGVYIGLKLKGGKLLVPVMIYCLILCFMFAKAISLCLALVSVGNMGGILVGAGAALFVLSDFMLGVGFFGDKSYKKQVINMAAYFPAQMLLALSIMFVK